MFRSRYIEVAANSTIAKPAGGTGSRRCSRRWRARRGSAPPARTEGARRSAPRRRAVPSRAASRRACSPPASRRRSRPALLEGAELVDQLLAPRIVHAAGLSPEGAAMVPTACRSGGTGHTRGTQNAVSFGTCGFDSHLRHRWRPSGVVRISDLCAAVTPSPTLTPGCCSSASASARRPRSSRSRATTSRRPTRCSRCGRTRRASASAGRLRWGLIPHSPIPTPRTGR